MTKKAPWSKYDRPGEQVEEDKDILRWWRRVKNRQWSPGELLVLVAWSVNLPRFRGLQRRIEKY